MAPVFGTIEKVILKQMREIVGFKSGDGLLFPGNHLINSLNGYLLYYRPERISIDWLQCVWY